MSAADRPSAEQRGQTLHVPQGTHAVSTDPEVVMTTVLGSCVATCLFDTEAGVGGMNHFLLPDGGDAAASGRVYGVNLMELLINGLLRRGADRRRMIAKLFGGANVIVDNSTVGRRNAAFARTFLAEEGIRCTAHSLGGKSARRIRFWPTSGRVTQLMLDADPSVIGERPAPPAPEGGEIELWA